MVFALVGQHLFDAEPVRDIGCGDGLFSAMLKPLVISLIATGDTPVMKIINKKNGRRHKCAPSVFYRAVFYRAQSISFPACIPSEAS